MSTPPNASRRPVRRLLAAVAGDGDRSVVDVLRHGLTWRWRRLSARHRWIERFAARSEHTTGRVIETVGPRVPSPIWEQIEKSDRGKRLRQRATAHHLQPRPGVASSPPRVTVVVTSYNRSELLPVALRSVQLQDLVDLECIVVDDASTDDATIVAGEFVTADERFRLLVHPTRLGVAAARNTGVAAATSDLVCFLDDDDFLLDGSLRSRLERLEGEPAEVAGSICDWINTAPQVGLERFSRPRRPPRDRGIIGFADLAQGAPFIVSAPLLRRSVFLELGGFDESLRRAEDVELWGRIMRVGYRFVDAVHVGVAYRNSPQSVVVADPADQLARLVEVCATWDRPDPGVVGHGPFPIDQPVSELAARRAMTPQVVKYLALIAYHDADRAIAVGHDLLSAPVRSLLDTNALRPRLRQHVLDRLDLTEPVDVRRVEHAVDVLLDGLVPRPAAWSGVFDSSSWAASHRHRGSEAGAVPKIVPSAAQLDGAVVLIGEARYHIDELGPLADELRARNIPVCFMASPKTVSTALAELGRYTAEVVEYAPDAVGRAAAVVVLNDWSPVRSLIELANERGVPTFAKVEGVQDFDDVDTGRRRDPYRTAAVVLGQGPNDAAALPGRPVEIVGSSRLERIWREPAVTRGEHALVNLNFTYRVLTERRDQWMRSIADALGSTGAPGLISCHPAERAADWGLPVAAKPFRHEITRAGLLISRFSTVPFEAMARGVPFVYHNPHGERVPTFTRPDGAFDVTTSVEDLARAIERWLGPAGDDYRATSASFFLRQVDVLEDRTPAQRTADVIELAIGDR